MITLFRGTTFTGEETELMPGEWKAVLANPLQWDWQQHQDTEWADNEVEFRYAATNEGERVYQNDAQLLAYFQSQFWSERHPGQWGQYRGQEGTKP